MDENSIIWKAFHSLWILGSFIIFFNGIGFIWIGLRVKEKKWIYEGLIYEIPFILALFVSSNNSLLEGVMLIYLVTWLVCIIRTFLTINEYLNRLREKSNSYNYNNNMMNNQQYNTPINSNNSIDFNPASNIPNENNFNNNYSDNSYQMSFETNNTEIEVIDINYASFAEIVNLPYFNSELANRLIVMRNSGDYVKSFNDLSQKLNLNENQINVLKNYIKISTNQSNRKLDL